MGASAAEADNLNSDERSELEDFRRLFEVQWGRMAEATARWRAEDPAARSLSMPDLGALLKWLMDDVDRLNAVVEQARRLNGPMVTRLRGCAADTSPNWAGAVTVYPPETRGLVALIDALVLGTTKEPAVEPIQKHRDRGEEPPNGSFLVIRDVARSCPQVTFWRNDDTARNLGYATRTDTGQETGLRWWQIGADLGPFAWEEITDEYAGLDFDFFLVTLPAPA